MKHIFIINPKAGTKDHSDELINEIKSLSSNIDHTVYETKSQGDAIIFCQEYIKNHPSGVKRFYACGGDGTLNEVVNGVVGHEDCEVACVPIGSGNDFLKYFGKAEDFRKINQLVKGKTVLCDLLKLNDRYVVNVFNIGIDAKVVVLQRKFKRWPLISGTGAYHLGVITSLLGKINHRFEIMIDDKLIYDGKVTLCAVANAICYGGGYYCAPLAKTNDGLLDVCVVKKVSRFTFASLVKVYKNGRHLQDDRVKPYIIYEQGSKVQINVDRILPYSIDGELEYAKDITINVDKNVLRFVVPTIDNSR